MLSKQSPTDIEGIYDSYLNELQDKNRRERYEGMESWYHASGAGSCSRKLYFESVEQIKPTSVFDERTKRLLQLGNLIHDDVQKSLTHARALHRDTVSYTHLTLPTKA